MSEFNNTSLWMGIVIGFLAHWGVMYVFWHVLIEKMKNASIEAQNYHANHDPANWWKNTVDEEENCEETKKNEFKRKDWK